MIATTCPSEGNSEETWHTLQYAKRAKTIRVAATRNEETKQRQQMEKEVEELRKSAEGREELEAQHRAEIEALEDFMKQTWEDKQRLTREHEEQRDLARLEVQRAMEQRKAEQQRRLEALEKLGDLHVTLQRPPRDFATSRLREVVQLQEQQQELREELEECPYGDPSSTWTVPFSSAKPVQPLVAAHSEATRALLELELAQGSWQTRCAEALGHAETPLGRLS
ncbi:unnamed protein product [Effrenium voratum]|nr:unnamed protein product [Effrenium voratum]